MGEVTLKVPAEYAEDFRAAVIDEIATDTEGVKNEAKEAEEFEARQRMVGNPPSDADRRLSTELLERSIVLAQQVNLGASGAIDVRTTDTETLAHACEAMARKIVGPKLADALGVGPIDEDWAKDSLRPLIDELAWAVDAAAGGHNGYWADRNGGGE